MLRLEMKQVKLIYIYEHLTGEEMLTYDQSRISRISYAHLFSYRKSHSKTKTIDDIN